jgi:hypothetical protein
MSSNDDSSETPRWLIYILILGGIILLSWMFDWPDVPLVKWEFPDL